MERFARRKLNSTVSCGETGDDGMDGVVSEVTTGELIEEEEAEVDNAVDVSSESDGAMGQRCLFGRIWPSDSAMGRRGLFGSIWPSDSAMGQRGLFGRIWSERERRQGDGAEGSVW